MTGATLAPRMPAWSAGSCCSSWSGPWALCRGPRRSPATGRAQSGDPSPAAPPVNLLEFEPLARQRLSPATWDYIAQGAADELTLRRNREAFDAIRLKPRVLVDVSALDTRLELFGQKLDFPILLAPVAGQGLIHSGGRAGSGPRRPRRRGDAGGQHLRERSHRGGSRERRAVRAVVPALRPARSRPSRAIWSSGQRLPAGTALCITVDHPRDPDARSREAPGHSVFLPGHPRAPGGRVSPIYADALDPTVTWETIGWIRSFAKTPVLLKGILAPEDARRAVAEGVAGVIVSNHGGRNLDTTPATIEALPAVAAAVQGPSPSSSTAASAAGPTSSRRGRSERGPS